VKKSDWTDRELLAEFFSRPMRSSMSQLRHIVRIDLLGFPRRIDAALSRLRPSRRIAHVESLRLQHAATVL
jgi:hypothetical protein